MENTHIFPFIYNEAPEDVLELIVSMCSFCVFEQAPFERHFRGLNAFRLTNKRFKRLADAVTTEVIAPKGSVYVHTVQTIPYLDGCKRVDTISCQDSGFSGFRAGLDRCPLGLKRLWIGHAPHLDSIDGLSSCSLIESLTIADSNITNISVVSLMPFLEEFVCDKPVHNHQGFMTRGPSIEDISPLSLCHRLRILSLRGNEKISDLSAISSLTALTTLDINECYLITDLSPLSSIESLMDLGCFLGSATSLRHLASCTGLKTLQCVKNATGLDELMKKRPGISVTATLIL